ncbi:MAG: hypothetical protein LQ339_007869 [Xanthoria mediterranea]|nr:MAG: hypothetical protein LQ339_007869 [Xanthoria mediterranea]
MSGELAIPAQEDTANHSISKQLPNSHSQPTATDNIDPSPSAASPVTSTFLNSATTTTQTSPAQTTTSNPDQSQQPTTDPTASAQPAPVGQVDPLGGEKASRRGSRGSVKLSSRRGSGASNKLVKKERTTGPVAVSEEKSGEGITEASAKPKKKGLSRLFSILNCCGAPKDANDSEQDQAVPSKRAKTLQPTRGRQTTPVTKVNNASAGESSNTESKEAIEDNIAGKRYSELTPSAQPNIIEAPKKEPPVVEKSPLQNDPVPLAEPKIAAVPSPATDQPLPPLPVDTASNRDTAMTNTRLYDEKPTTTSTDGLVEAPIPPTAGIPEGGVSKEEAAINDRTLQQEAKDVEMSDAPPVAPTPVAPAPSQETSIQSPPQTNLPPPPPPPNQGRISAANRRTSIGVAGDQPKGLLPPIADRFRGKKCLVLDLDETLVHSSFKILHQADFTIPVEIEGQYHNVYVIKRPGVDQFMKRVGELYEVVVFTASVSKYGDPLLDQLDIHNVVHHRLFRESCYNHQGNYVKDLSQVGRDLRETIIIDNSPTSYIFHPQHAVPISSWFSDAHDNELIDLIPVLEDLAGPQVRDVSLVLDVGL